MLNLKCTTKDTALITEMIPFQGDLKKRTDKDLKELADSLLADGLLMPFALWTIDNKLYILDGHGRYTAIITKVAIQDPSVLTQEFPVILIDATTEDEARKALLQIISTYGKISKAGLTKFAAPVANYVAPIIKHTAPIVKHDHVKDENIVVKLKVHKDMVSKLLDILKPIKGIEVL
jgi:hypothetical protein